MEDGKQRNNENPFETKSFSKFEQIVMILVALDFFFKFTRIGNPISFIEKFFDLPYMSSLSVVAYTGVMIAALNCIRIRLKDESLLLELKCLMNEICLKVPSLIHLYNKEHEIKKAKNSVKGNKIAMMISFFIFFIGFLMLYSTLDAIVGYWYYDVGYYIYEDDGDEDLYEIGHYVYDYYFRKD